MEKWLISKAQIDDFEKATGQSFPKDRRRGRSTAIALETIAAAIRSPGNDVKIIDHWDNRQSNRYLMETIADVINKLGLKGFSLEKSELLLKFRLYEVEPGVNGMNSEIDL